jgi:hypothetical protein
MRLIKKSMTLRLSLMQAMSDLCHLSEDAELVIFDEEYEYRTAKYRHSTIVLFCTEPAAGSFRARMQNFGIYRCCNCFSAASADRPRSLHHIRDEQLGEAEGDYRCLIIRSL